MALSNLPDELIAHISTYLGYSDVCSLKETAKKNYISIKIYNKDKIKLEQLSVSNEYGFLTLEACTTSKKYSFKHLNRLKEASTRNIISILEECSSIDHMRFYEIDFTSDLASFLMGAKIEIRNIAIASHKMLISADELSELCQKFKRVTCSHEQFDPALLNDAALTRILPDSSIVRETFYPMANVGSSDLITDCTLNALFGGTNITGNFCIRGVHTSISLNGIVEAIKILDKRDTTGLSWDLGILQVDQANDAQLLFKKETGALSKNYYIVENEFNGFHVYMVESLVENKFRVKFCIVLN